MRYRITPDAAEDLIAIWRYSACKWGDDQADHYTGSLKDACVLLGENSQLGKPLAHIHSRLRVYRHDHHYIFYLAETHQVSVLAFFHERMDALQRLGKRLTPQLPQ